MGYKCIVCGSNEVENYGDVCELCSIGQDPYTSAMQGTPQVNVQVYANENNDQYRPGKGKSRKVLLSGGAAIANTDPYGNSMLPQDTEDIVQVYQAGQLPTNQGRSATVTQNTSKNMNNSAATGNQPITCGITKNITLDNQKKSFLMKWFRTLFTGIPFTFDDDITMFQVFPDYTGTSLNAMGNACDQVIVYGRVKAGVVAENNDVEVYGHRDSSNNIVAKKIKNKASGTTVSPERTLSFVPVWIITIIVGMMMFSMISALGVVGIMWVGIALLCLTNLPLVFKIIGAVIGFIFTLFKKMM